MFPGTSGRSIYVPNSDPPSSQSQPIGINIQNRIYCHSPTRDNRDTPRHAHVIGDDARGADVPGACSQDPEVGGHIGLHKGYSGSPHGAHRTHHRDAAVEVADSTGDDVAGSAFHKVAGHVVDMDDQAVGAGMEPDAGELHSQHVLPSTSHPAGN